MKKWKKIVLAIVTTLMLAFLVIFIIPNPVNNSGEILQCYEDDFSTDTLSAYSSTGETEIENEKLKLICNGDVVTSLDDYVWCEATYEFDIDFSGTTEWSGVQFNKENLSDTRDESGYLFYIRNSGNCRIYSANGGVIAKGYIPPITKKVHIRIVTEIGSIKVYLNNIKFPIVSVKDNSFIAGYFSFASINNSVTYYDNLKITQYKSYGEVKAVELDKSITSLSADSETELDVSVYPFDADKSTLEWTVTDLYGNETDLASIENGIIKTTSKGGAVKVNVSCGNFTDSVDLLIKGALPIKAEKDAKIMKKGTSIQMYADTEVKWSVTDTNGNKTDLATIDNNGVLTAKEKGTVKVVATDKDGNENVYPMTIGEISTNGQESVKEMNYAFFAHYVPELTCDNNGNVITDKDILASTFNAEAFADEMAKAGVQYVVFTAFHFRMVCLYPSEVMKQWGMDSHYTERDLIGEMIDAVQAKGINVALYVHPYDGYDFASVEEAQKTGWGNTTEYPRPDYTSFDHDKWNEFIQAVYGEVMDRYGDRIFAMWSDEGNNQDDGMSQAVDFSALIKAIKSRNKNLITFQNVYYDQYGMDIAIKEYWHWGEFASTDGNTWISYKSRVPAIVFGKNWWSEGSNYKNTVTYSPESIYRYQVLQASCNETGGGIQWASGPVADKNGGFQNGVSDTLEIVNCYLNPVSWTVKGTLASKAYPTADGTSINDISAFVATESQDGSETYIHILKNDSELINGNTIIIPLPADSREFTSAKLSISNRQVAMQFTDEGIKLSLPDGEKFNSVDTVITLVS